jgi:hypothetical protein
LLFARMIPLSCIRLRTLVQGPDVVKFFARVRCSHVSRVSQLPAWEQLPEPASGDRCIVTSPAGADDDQNKVRGGDLSAGASRKF